MIDPKRFFRGYLPYNAFCAPAAANASTVGSINGVCVDPNFGLVSVPTAHTWIIKQVTILNQAGYLNSVLVSVGSIPSISNTPQWPISAGDIAGSCFIWAQAFTHGTNHVLDVNYVMHENEVLVGAQIVCADPDTDLSNNPTETTTLVVVTGLDVY